jgi:hypothetical protein
MPSCPSRHDPGPPCPAADIRHRFDDDGSCEVAIFAGPRARERALRYADRQYGLFEEVDLGRAP